ncbi:hypothetical protein ACFV2V_04875 [Streptomyces sp. NPDC059698]|uniref:hypothetical protein n=1 Tax=unclassified Streptomyces TaxID=2593676 RepID=UPI00093F130C|nr:hypothetical protein [Streptomyces sp. CB02366]OKJ39515.1 hypothetical protein AMK24_07705 [Streptomyces sp. CB02366]TVP37945.1 hypothetical protein A3L22_23990 [Streptomyces griseus subsp. griseus]
MRSMPITFCAVAASALIAVPAPVALASPAAPAGDDDRRTGTVSITPSTTAPGAEVELWTDACGRGRHAKGNSDAFASVAHFRPADDKGLFARARIRSDAEPRSYDVWVTCEDSGGRATGALTVVHHTRPSPAAPVKAGGGGAATLAERSAEAQGPGIRHAVTGLVLAAVAAVAVALRTSRRRRGPAGS